MPKPDQNRKTERNAREDTSVSAADVIVAFFAWIATLPDALWDRVRRIVPRARTLVREHRAGRFPESNRPLIQFLLFLPGIFPMWKSLAREHLFRLRRRSLNRDTAIAARTTTSRGRLHPVLFACVALVFASVGAFFAVYTPATTVSYNGETLEIVRDSETARSIAARVERLTAATMGSGYSFPEDSIQYTSSLVRRSELGEVERLEQELTDEIGLVTYGYSLYIDDELVGSTQYKGALEALLEQITKISVSDDTISVDFVEDVRFSEGYVRTDSLKNLGEIAEKLNSTKAGEETYTVVKGDTWGQIAYDNGMSNDELLALNPGYNIDRINIGDELVLSREIPYLTVKVTERQNYVGEIDYEIIYIDDSSMYQGDTRVIEKGEYGTADIVADVVYVNGMETERTVISQVMLTEPKTETRTRGTKARPTWLPTGSFRWPVSGRVTSGFGYRNTGIRGASTNHMGIDIACSYGTSIGAADGGTVEYTGYKGAMGYTVIINHGNGFKTYYEHCSSFAVSAGAHVYKGQTIAYVGMSGVTSGPHCHFGVQVNGSYVNPLRYLP